MNCLERCVSGDHIDLEHEVETLALEGGFMSLVSFRLDQETCFDMPKVQYWIRVEARVVYIHLFT